MELEIDGEMYDVESSEFYGKQGNIERELVVVCPRVSKDLYEVLDDWFVRYIDHMGDDLSIVRAARVSYDADWREGMEGKTQSDDKLIRYLMMNSHTSPFEAVQFTFEIKVPLFLARQWHRHRTWAYNEVSARYTELDMGHFVPEPQFIGIQSKDNKQGTDFVPWNAMTSEEQTQAQRACEIIDRSCIESFDAYSKLLKMGVPRERARVVLPVASYTRYFGSVNLHNLFHFLQLRLHSHAQYEIRQYAEAILAIIEPKVPVAVASFKEKINYGDE